MATRLPRPLGVASLVLFVTVGAPIARVYAYTLAFVRQARAGRPAS